MGDKNFFPVLFVKVRSDPQNQFLYFLFRIYKYGVISRESSVLIFGGFCADGESGSSSSRIAKYTLDKWEQVGNLQQNRYEHRAIANGDRIYVVGGSGTKRCEVTDFFDMKFYSS